MKKQNYNTELIDYTNKLPIHFAMQQEEEREYLKKAQKGCEKSISILYKNNLRLVVSTAKSLWYNKSIDIMDLISEGNLAIYTAVLRFDLNFNEKNRLSSYIMFWIRKYILEFLRNEKKENNLSLDETLFSNNKSLTLGDNIKSNDTTPFEKIELSSFKTCVNNKLNQIFDKKHLKIINLHYKFGLSYPKISEVMELRLDQVYNANTSIKNRMRNKKNEKTFKEMLEEIKC